MDILQIVAQVESIIANLKIDEVEQISLQQRIVATSTCARPDWN